MHLAMTSSRHALILVAFMLAGCAVTPPSTPLPEAAAYARPADGFLRVSPMTVDTSQGSVWGWRVRAPEGTWKVVCRYEGWSGGDQFSADVRFPSGAKLPLPADGVSTACSGISREPELEAWRDDRGRVLLRLHGGPRHRFPEPAWPVSVSLTGV